MERQAVDILGGQQHGQHARAGHALFNQLRRFVGSDRGRLTTAAAVDFADMFDHPDLHRHDIQLLAGFFADDMLAATAGTGQFVFGQLVDDFNAWQISRQWLAIATAWRRSNDFLVSITDRKYRLAFGLIEQRQLRRVGLCGLFRFTTEYTVTQQLDLFFQINDVSLVCLYGYVLAAECLKQHFLEQNRVIRKVFGQGSHAQDYTRQATNLGVKTLCGQLRHRSNPSSNQFSSCTVRTMASSVASGEAWKRSDSRRLSQRQKPLRSQ